MMNVFSKGASVETQGEQHTPYEHSNTPAKTTDCSARNGA